MESTWNGFKREDFLFNGFKCILVSPEHPLPGNPFVWRAEFFDAFAQCDLEMVRRGYYLTYINLSDKYGCLNSWPHSAVPKSRAGRSTITARFCCAIR